MNIRKSELASIGVILLAIVALVGLAWANYRYVVENPGGNDFIPRWLGTRLLLMEGWSPYSEETTQEIQKMMYDRSARSGEDRALFVYPFYSIYIFAPFALIADYHIARALWMTSLQVSLIILAAVSLSLSDWRLKPTMLVIYLLFAVLWYHSVRPLINGNAAILVALFIAASFQAIRAGQDGLAGFLLALSTIKPQMVVLLLPFVLIWSISHRRQTLFWSLLGSLVLLIASTSLLIPNWLWQNLIQVLAYPDYTLPGTPRAIISEWLPGVGNKLGWALTIFMVGTLLWEWRSALGKEFQWFYWTACLTLVVTNLIGVRTTTANYIALFPALVLVLANWDQHWGVIGRGLVLLSYLLLFFGLWWIFIKTLLPGDQPVQHSVLFFPLPVFLLLGLYWIRWWVLRPKGPLFDRLRRSTGSRNFL